MRKLISPLFCLCLSSVLFAPSAGAAIVASWSAEGNANDSAGSHNGSLVNGAGFGTGISGQAFLFDGSNDFVSVPDDNAWAFGSSPFTIALWANFDVVKQGPISQAPNVFIGQDQGAGEQNKWIFFYDGDGKLAFHINDSSPSFDFILSPNTFSPVVGDWHHIALTRAGNDYSFYADGTFLGTAVNTRLIPDAAAALTIGQAEGLGFFDGRLDEIQIYNEALSASQIAALSEVPVPAAAWLFASGILGLIGIGRVKKGPA